MCPSRVNSQCKSTPGGTELDQGIAMAAALCDLPLEAMDEMDAGDFAAISEVLASFLPRDPA